MATLFNSNHPRRLIPDMSVVCCNKGWFFSIGGGISLLQGKNIYMPPANYPPDRLTPDELFVFVRNTGAVMLAPEKSLGLEPTPESHIFLAIFSCRQPGAILHSRSNKVLVTCQIVPGPEFRIKNQAMIRGIVNDATKLAYNYDDEIVVPIINDVRSEDVLATKIRKCLLKYPSTSAIFVRGRGLYCWAKDARYCYSTAECYHQLLDLTIELEKLGINEAVDGSSVTEAVGDDDPAEVDQQILSPDPATRKSDESVVEKEPETEDIGKVDGEKEDPPAKSEEKPKGERKRNDKKRGQKNWVRQGKVGKRGQSQGILAPWSRAAEGQNPYVSGSKTHRNRRRPGNRTDAPNRDVDFSLARDLLMNYL